MTTYRGYEISADGLGYAVYKDGKTISAGLQFGQSANLAAAKKAIRDVIAGKREPLNLTGRLNP